MTIDRDEASVKMHKLARRLEKDNLKSAWYEEEARQYHKRWPAVYLSSKENTEN